LMELVNHVTKNRVKYRVVSEALVRMVASFAPHAAEEMWQLLEHDDTVFAGGWPDYDEAATLRATVEYVVQVNGKVRAKMELAAGLVQEEVERLALENQAVEKWLEGKTIVKKIYVPDKLLNIVVK